MRALVAALLVLLAHGCAHRHAAPPLRVSGFLDDYALLREGGPNDLSHVYRDPKANWREYDKVLLEPVTLWRSGRKSLEPVPQEDLLRLVSDFQDAVRAGLGEGFRLVDRAGPGVMRIRLAITDAHVSDPVLDVLTAPRGTGHPHPAGDGPLDPETRRFLEAALVEGEIRDARTDALLAEGVDRRRRGAPALQTWAEVDRAFALWADRMCARLEARAGAR
ncbi:MAG: DUF3313 domain-containing protein [Candidatus Binatia bacterium]